MNTFSAKKSFPPVASALCLVWNKDDVPTLVPVPAREAQKPPVAKILEGHIRHPSLLEQYGE